MSLYLCPIWGQCLQYLFCSKRESVVYMDVDSLWGLTNVGLFRSTLGLTFTATDHACSFEGGFSFRILSAVQQADISPSQAISECSLFFIPAQLLFSHSPQSSCSCVQELFCSITRLYPKLIVSSTTYIQLLALSDLCYMNKKAGCSAWLSLVASVHAQVNSWYF